MSSLKHRVISAIIELREKGYANDADDSGGATRFGITEAVARRAGWTGPMAELPVTFAETVYDTEYWSKLRLDDVAQLSEPVAAEMADTGVNAGTGTAAQFLQRGLNALNNRATLWPDLKVDGAVGPATIGALRAFFAHHRGSDAEPAMVALLNGLQCAYYVDLVERREKDEKFFFGWLKHRVVLSAMHGV